MFRPRPAQAQVLAWRGGKLGVSAVPGSGKTATLVALAARLVRAGGLAANQEVLIVTLVNSAVNNFSSRLAGELQHESAFLPGLVGYRVRTLHGLANDVVKERPGLAGLADDFRVIDERETQDILQEAVDGWLRGNPGTEQGWVDEALQQRSDVRQRHWPALLRDVAGRYIRQAKDVETDVDKLNAHCCGARAMPCPWAQICQEIYASYENGLRYRGGIDFTDLIRLALRVLKSDADYLARLQRRWPWILEDEAQDSSWLQERILRLLSGPQGNWGRVGDPNQAINESFTTASPRYLRDFLQEPDVQAHPMPNSGRSAPAIIRLANGLIDWAQAHPQPQVRARKPLEPPYIEPAPPCDSATQPARRRGLSSSAPRGADLRPGTRAGREFPATLAAAEPGAHGRRAAADQRQRQQAGGRTARGRSALQGKPEFDGRHARGGRFPLSRAGISGQSAP